MSIVESDQVSDMKRTNVVWLCLVWISLSMSVMSVFAQSTEVNWQSIYDRLKQLVTIFNMLAWIGVFLGWAMGIFTRILPIPSREVKQTGQGWTEWAGIGAFLLASGLTIFNIFLWLFGTQLPQGI